jgi:hypothetical protein
MQPENIVRIGKRYYNTASQDKLLSIRGVAQSG